MNILKNFSVKKYIAIIVSTAFVILAIMGKINTDSFMNVLLMIVTFYFAQSGMKDAIDQTKNMTEKESIDK